MSGVQMMASKASNIKVSSLKTVEQKDEEKKRLRGVFDKIDINGDGTLDVEEV